MEGPARMSSKPTKLHYVLNVPLDRQDKRLLDRLCKERKLPQTTVIRQLIREATRELKVAANG